MLCGSDLLTGPTGSAQVDFLLSDELADAVSPGSALHGVLSARTSFHEVRQFVYLVVLNRPKVCLYCGGSGENWVFLHLSKSFNLSWPQILFLKKSVRWGDNNTYLARFLC